MDKVELKIWNDRLPAAVKEAQRLISGSEITHKVQFVLTLAAIVPIATTTGLVASGATAAITVVITMASFACIVLLMLSLGSATKQEMISPADLYRTHRDIRTNELRKIFTMLRDWDNEVALLQQQLPDTSEYAETLALLQEQQEDMEKLVKHAERLMAKGPLGTVRTVDHDDQKRIELYQRQKEAREFTKEIEFRNQGDDFVRRIEERNETKKLG